MVPALADMPSGCAFRTRCPAATETCARMPELDDGPTRVACWHPITTSDTQTSEAALGGLQ
jgi:ABC-type dipeptide/oligopeptide/nickel transport system ATPase component